MYRPIPTIYKRISDVYKPKANMTFELFLDDKKVLTKSVKAGDFPEKLDVDVTKANKIRLKVTSDQKVEVGLFDARFSK
ncbi:NPCBM/NEW2 domain-containing protein [Anaerobacillus sp. MEB173]|uniref:NPCBM/NEW2 domain-containing protein n=1 Tax=Anaerobacillus sp. MEB173 TaxID=3383345 RepID=UPI003F905A39